MSTVRLLAKLAGVSIATVSRAINGHPSVRPETREHIIALAQEYQYHPNRLSQSVMSGNNTTFGLLVPHVNDLFYSQIVSELLKCAYKEDYQVIILETFSEYKRTIHAISALIEQRVAGIFACTPCEDIIPMDVIYAIRSNYSDSSVLVKFKKNKKYFKKDQKGPRTFRIARRIHYTWQKTQIKTQTQFSLLSQKCRKSW